MTSAIEQVGVSNSLQQLPLTLRSLVDSITMADDGCLTYALYVDRPTKMFDTEFEYFANKQHMTDLCLRAADSTELLIESLQFRDEIVDKLVSMKCNFVAFVSRSIDELDSSCSSLTVNFYKIREGEPQMLCVDLENYRDEAISAVWSHDPRHKIPNGVR